MDKNASPTRNGEPWSVDTDEDCNRGVLRRPLDCVRLSSHQSRAGSREKGQRPHGEGPLHDYLEITFGEMRTRKKGSGALANGVALSIGRRKYLHWVGMFFLPGLLGGMYSWGFLGVPLRRLIVFSLLHVHGLQG